MSDLDRMLRSHDFEIWNAEDGADIVGETLDTLKSLTGEFRRVGDRIDAQSSGHAGHGATTNSQLADLNRSVVALNKSVASLLSSHVEMHKALLSIGKAMAAPKRLIKDANGKPVGVEVMT